MKYLFNKEISSPIHNHEQKGKLNHKLHEREIADFIKDNVHQNNDKPALLRTKLNLKFPSLSIDYAYSANLLYRIKQEMFGDPSKDAQNLVGLCREAEIQFPNFYFKSKTNPLPENRFSGIFISTPTMRTEYKKYNNLLIIDTTFGTNRFKLPLMLGTMVNNMGRTVLAFFALVASETIDEFNWVFTCFMECFEVAPANVMTDECQSFAAAIKNKLKDSEHFICGWHKENTIKKKYE